jgi:ribonuclease HI
MQKVILYTDGGSRGNPGVAGAGVAVVGENGQILKTASRPLGRMTNNEAEYQAVILGLETLKKLFGKDKLKELAVENRLDSELVCRQLSGVYQTKEDHLWPLFMKIWNLRVAEFPNLTFTHIPREDNALADKMANEAMAAGGGAQQAELL